MDYYLQSSHFGRVVVLSEGALNFQSVTVEAGHLTKLAVPVVLSQLALMGMGVTDIVVAGRSGTDQLAGMTLGNNLWNLVAYFFFGIGLAAQPLIGHAFGAGDRRGIRRQFQQAIYAAIFTGIICFLSALLMSQILLNLGYEKRLAQIGSSYLGVMAFGGMAMTLLPVLRSTLEAMSQTKVVTTTLLTAFLINIPLDYVLVIGYGPFPALGSVGCAYASVIVLWFVIVWLSLLLGSRSRNRHLRLMDRFNRPNIAIIKENLKLGLPIGFTVTIELGLFVTAALLIGYFGAVSTAAHSVAISAASVCYMFYMGLGQGVVIRASQLLGAGESSKAWFSIRLGIAMTGALATLMSLSIFFLRTHIPGLYSNDAEVIQLASVLLIWAAIFQIGDSLQCVGMYGLRAYKDTLTPLRYQLVSFWVIGFPIGYLLATREASPLYGPEGYWVGMCSGLILSALLISRQLWLTGSRQPDYLASG